MDNGHYTNFARFQDEVCFVLLLSFPWLNWSHSGIVSMMTSKLHNILAATFANISTFIESHIQIWVLAWIPQHTCVSMLNDIWITSHIWPPHMSSRARQRPWGRERWRERRKLPGWRRLRMPSWLLSNVANLFSRCQDCLCIARSGRGWKWICVLLNDIRGNCV